MSAIVTETSTFSASVTVPSPGDNVTAASVANAIQPLCNRTQALVDGKITVKSGVTFTGNLGCTWLNNGTTTLANTSCTTLAATAITCTTLAANGGTVASVSGTATSNGTGVKGTGAGSGSGTTGQGGATGAGVIGTGGATSGVGVAGVGGPSSAGVTGTGGASGPGVKGVGGSGNVGIECGAGNMRFTGTQPVKTADPGFDNYACGTNQAKSWALVDLNSGTITITDGYNTASLAFSGSYIQVTFARAITNPVVHATLSTIAVPMFTVVSSTVVQIGMYTVTAGAFAQVNLSSTTATLGISVFGRQ